MSTRDLPNLRRDFCFSLIFVWLFFCAYSLAPVGTFYLQLNLLTDSCVQLSLLKVTVILALDVTLSVTARISLAYVFKSSTL